MYCPYHCLLIDGEKKIKPWNCMTVTPAPTFFEFNELTISPLDTKLQDNKIKSNYIKVTKSVKKGCKVGSTIVHNNEKKLVGNQSAFSSTSRR